MSRDLTVKHTRAKRSIGTFRAENGVTSVDKPFYISNTVGNEHRASIYNDTAPKERHYTDGVEVATVHFTRGQSFTDCFYDEGCDHSAGYVKYDIINN